MGLEINVNTTQYMFMYRGKNAGWYEGTKFENSFFLSVCKFSEVLEQSYQMKIFSVRN
jgi:hypothetical protein